MNKSFLPLLAFTVSAVLFSACRTPGPYPPKEAEKYDLEATEKFVLMDPGAQVSVTCPRIQERTLDDGRIEVVPQIRNRENRRIQVQVNCVFKNAAGISTGDETPWETLILTENGQEAVKFTSMNNLAKRYTIRVRQAR